MELFDNIFKKRIHNIKTSQIIPNPNQPRTHFNEDNIEELAQSILQFGIIQPLIVRKNIYGNYELVAGERRLRAAKRCGLKEVPCMIVDVNEKQSSAIALIENIQRCDLDFFEEAEAIQRLIRQFGLSQDEAARRLGKSQSAIANKLRILRHSQSVIEKIREYKLTERHARTLLRLQNEEEKLLAIAHINEHNLNVAQSEEYIDKLLSTTENTNRKIKVLYAFKDVRLFMNTINQALDMMKYSGIDVEFQKQETGDIIELNIKIPKNLETVKQ